MPGDSHLFPPFAAIFDWDGVIIDSHDLHEESWYLLAAENSLPVPENFFKRSFGMRNAEVIRDLAQWSNDHEEIKRLSDRKEELYRSLILKKGIAPLPGVIPFLENLKQKSIPTAIGSSSVLLNITTVLNLLRLDSYFDVILTGADVSEGKPSPEIFLKCSEQLGIPPSYCIVFEDAHVGIQAAKRAGMVAVAVTTTHPAYTFDQADKIVDRLDQLSIEALLQLSDLNRRPEHVSASISTTSEQARLTRFRRE
ncbi:MAG: HAD family phosphatase [Methylacidiphilales bacterium]|nr:HAD family phosphatase [Candidatus Methylacidiphilales bacterium]MDW8350157.1 HAD family phosphatase [Verrucomicrobiae bacterium]